MDINLPGIQGREATRRIMAQTPTPTAVVPGIDREEMAVVEKPVASGLRGVHESFPLSGIAPCVIEQVGARSEAL